MDSINKRIPIDVLATMSTFGKLVAEDKKGGSWDWEKEMTRALIRVAELIDAGNALDLHHVEADGVPAHWRFNHAGARRFIRALAAVQIP